MLQSSDLPVADLSPDDMDSFLFCGEREQPAGIIGLERCGDVALLRSLVVDPRSRDSGCGKALVEQIETQALRQGISAIYLLTETAEHFFQKRGYCEISRNEVPQAIQQTAEFSSLCPDSATVMKKSIA